MNEAFSYTGNEELQQAKYLVRYNHHIASLFAEETEPHHHLLDFGAGVGTITDLVCDIAQPERITCVEIDPDNVATLEAKGYQVVTDSRSLPAETIDVMYSSNVLEHVEDDIAELEKLYPLMKPGGVAVFWVPAFDCLWTKMDDRVE
ncbi:MAG: class I SAM-dependent methyltransferase, partial [Rhodothermia bacterium]|nr:class I SAM-dependent methyltransferase [Rhodothermia bacterium]